MARRDYSGHGTVCMNPLGPHFYINVEEGEAPPSDADSMTDMMNHRLTEMNEEHGWPIIHEHIRAHTPITEVSWEPTDRAGYDAEYEIEDFDVSLDWYSREQLRDYEDW